MDATLQQLLALIFSQSQEIEQLRAENARQKTVIESSLPVHEEGAAAKPEAG